MLPSAPTFLDFFKSYYHSNTYVPTVDLSDKALSKYLVIKSDANKNDTTIDEADRLQNYISGDVSAILLNPIEKDKVQIEKNNNALMRGWLNLSQIDRVYNFENEESMQWGKYTTLKHVAASYWIIKSGADREQLNIPHNHDICEAAFYDKEEGILQIEMANRISQIAQDNNIKVLVPKMKLITNPNAKEATKASQKYSVLCEKLDFLSLGETVTAIKTMSEEKQKELAKNISTIVQKAGLAAASFKNIRLTKDGQITFINTKPHGLLVQTKPGLWNKFFGTKGNSVEKCARIGLNYFSNEIYEITRQDAGNNVKSTLTPFFLQIDNEYKSIATPKFSKWKIIGLSVLSLGLIPIINTIIALYKTKITNQILQDIKILRTSDFLRTEVHKRWKQRGITNQSPELKQNVIDEVLNEFRQEDKNLVNKFNFNIKEVPYPRASA